MAKRWYVVHAYSGFEKYVKRALEERVKLRSMEELFGEILVPTEEVTFWCKWRCVMTPGT